jgi:hypothetical protein
MSDLVILTLDVTHPGTSCKPCFASDPLHRSRDVNSTHRPKALQLRSHSVATTQSRTKSDDGTGTLDDTIDLVISEIRLFC